MRGKTIRGTVSIVVVTSSLKIGISLYATKNAPMRTGESSDAVVDITGGIPVSPMMLIRVSNQ